MGWASISLLQKNKKTIITTNRKVHTMCIRNIRKHNNIYIGHTEVQTTILVLMVENCENNFLSCPRSSNIQKNRRKILTIYITWVHFTTPPSGLRQSQIEQIEQKYNNYIKYMEKHYTNMVLWVQDRESLSS